MDNQTFGTSLTINKMNDTNMNEKIDIGPYNRGELCPYCHGTTKKISGGEIFGHGKGFDHILMFKCSGTCDAYCGSKFYQGQRVSIGSLANKELRELRKKCHLLFDAQWKGKRNEKLSKKKAYVWLQKFMNLPDELAHFGMFNIEQCNKVIEELSNKTNNEV